MKGFYSTLLLFQTNTPPISCHHHPTFAPRTGTSIHIHHALLPRRIAPWAVHPSDREAEEEAISRAVLHLLHYLLHSEEPVPQTDALQRALCQLAKRMLIDENVFP
jgi:hypothetical protein